MDTLLQGLKVIDLTRHVPGPYGTMLLADLGADVVVVGGAEARRSPNCRAERDTSRSISSPRWGSMPSTNSSLRRMSVLRDFVPA
ncbi:CoA transferase [Bradyrhizobium sp. CB82]|nr:CoA transferase [Bradyrhizobium sp. CB82]WFU41519.1 CoA transferase [Bradyrhizobium sp. CB82]